MDKKHLQLICTKMQLGFPIDAPNSIPGSRGGSFIWKVTTEKNYYAIKQLSPVIDIKNKKTIEKYELSETIAHHFLQNEVLTVSALQYAGKHLFIIEDKGYLIYPWINGHCLAPDEITKYHTNKIAQAIGQLHKINLMLPNLNEPRFDVHSNEKIVSAIEDTQSLQLVCSTYLKEKQGFILSCNDRYQAVIPILQESSVLTHGDIDRLNVIWNKEGQPVLIDWETARKLNPTREIIRASIGWSQGSLPIYAEMLKVYTELSDLLNTGHIEASLNSFYGSSINWMIYNIEQAKSGNLEMEKAGQEIMSVLESMIKFNELMPDLFKIAKKI